VVRCGVGYVGKGDKDNDHVSWEGHGAECNPHSCPILLISQWGSIDEYGCVI
jgi:hypothetical protein